jgi:Trk K+ transport system NAD-binding subunit
MAIKKLCKWAFMLRVDREFLGFDSINLYAIGQSPNTSNSKSMFDFINTARNHTEVAALQFNTNAKINGRKLKKLRTELQKHLDNL